jgi:hypothetical protein
MSGQMRAPDIARIVSENPDLVETCKHLIDLANENGGPDNITVIAARFEGAGLLPPASDEKPEHHIYSGESEGRATVPVSASTIPEFEPDTAATRAAQEAITDEVAAIPDTVTGPPAAAAAPPANTATPAAAAASASVDERRIPVGVLRVIFGSVAALVALYWILVVVGNR